MAQFRRLAEPDKGHECLHCLVRILIEISNEKKAGEDLTAYKVEEFEQLKPITLKYQPEISKEEIEKALSISTDQSAILSNDDLSKERAKARSSVIKTMLGGIAICLVAIVIGAAIPIGLFFFIGIAGLILGPIAFGWRLLEVSKSPGLDSPQSVAETFYREITSEGSLDSSLIAFQTLAPTATERPQVISLENLHSAWKQLNNDIQLKPITKHADKFGGSEPNFSTSAPHITVAFERDTSANISCEMNYLISKGIRNNIGWAKLQFTNHAIKIGNKWLLLAGDPGIMEIIE